MITLYGAGEGLFDRLGVLGGGIADLIAIRGGDPTDRVTADGSWLARVMKLLEFADLDPDNLREFDGLYTALSSWQQSQSGFLSQLRTFATNLVIATADADTPLASKTINAALALLIYQMRSANETVNASTAAVGNQTAVGTPTGNPVVAVSVKGNDGKTREYVLPETISFVVQSDSLHTATARRESIAVTTPAVVSDQTSQDWPGGSGVSTTINIVDSAQDATSGGNLLTNGDFEVFSVPNTPDNWSILVGAAGTDILATGSGYTQSNSLRFLEGGGVLSSVAQAQTSLEPNTVYAFNVFAKRSAGLSGAGTVEISLVDNSNTILTDDQGTQLKITQVASGLSTSFAKLSGFFQTPHNLADGAKLRIRLSVAIADSGQSVYFDDAALCEATELYTGGPYVAAFAGSTDPLINDSWTVAITNTFGGFQKLFQQLFDMRSLGLQLPSNSSGGETVSDDLIDEPVA